MSKDVCRDLLTLLDEPISPSLITSSKWWSTILYLDTLHVEQEIQKFVKDLEPGYDKNHENEKTIYYTGEQPLTCT